MFLSSVSLSSSYDDRAYCFQDCDIPQLSYYFGTNSRRGEVQGEFLRNKTLWWAVFLIFVIFLTTFFSLWRIISISSMFYSSLREEKQLGLAAGVAPFVAPVPIPPPPKFFKNCINVQSDYRKVIQRIFGQIRLLIEYNFLMDDDLKKGLLGKKSSGFDKLYEEGMVRIQRIKQKNDVIQKQIGTDIQESIRQQVNNQKVFIEKQINELKNLMTQIETKYRDPESKNRLKQLKLDAQKQIERNKIILKDLINKSFAARSIGRPHEQQNTEKYMLGGQINYNHLSQIDERQAEENANRQSLITDNEIEIDYELQRKILLQKNEMINEVQQSTMRINEIMNDMGMMVEEQGQNLDVITDELIKTNKNLTDANQNLEQASTLQKKAKRKYWSFIMLIILGLAVVGGVIYFIVG